MTVIHVDPTPEMVNDFVRKAVEADMVAFDIESSGLDPHLDRMLMAQFAVPDEDGTVLIFTQSIPVQVRALLGQVEVLGHNLKFDVNFFGQKVPGTQFNRVYDTMIAESSLNLGRSVRVGLGAVAKRRLNLDMDKDVRRSFIGRTDRNFSERELRYAARDVLALFLIKAQQEQEIAQYSLQKIISLENRTVLTTAAMERAGIGFDRTIWQGLIDRYEALLFDVVMEIYQQHPYRKPVHLGFFADRRQRIEEYVQAMNLNNPAQNILDIERMTGAKLESADAFNLKQLKSQSWFADALLRYRELNKMVGTYLYPMLDMIHPVTGRIHFDYSQISLWEGGGHTGTVTGRWSCKRFHQIPASKEIRSAFVAPPGWVMGTYDYSNVELRIAGNHSEDPAIIDFFNGNVQNVLVYRASVRGGGDHDVDVQYFRSASALKKWQSTLDDKLKVVVEELEAPVTDYHGYMAAKTFGIPLEEAVTVVIDGVELPSLHSSLRKKQKILNFASIYLVTKYGIRRQLNNPYPETLRKFVKIGGAEEMSVEQLAEYATPTQLEEAQLEEAEILLRNYEKAVPRLMSRLKQFGRFAVDNFYIKDHSWGRIRWFEPHVEDWKREKAGANMPVQATSASQMKHALSLVREEIPEVVDIGTVHDEGLYLIREDRVAIDGPRIKETMIRAATEVLPGPIAYTVGTALERSWTK